MKQPTVGEVMTAQVVSVPETATYHEVVEAIVDHGISAVPVLDREGRVVGVVSEADLLHKVEYAVGEPARHLLERRRTRTGRAKATGATAGDLMTKPAITIHPGAGVAAAAARLAEGNVKRLPVVDPSGMLLGIVSRRDLLRQFLRPDDQILSDIREQVLLRTLWMDPDSVAITVAAGAVTLAGAVDRRSTVYLIAALVSGVPGVIDVRNDLSYHLDDRPGHLRPSPVA